MSYLKKILKEDETATRTIRRYPFSFAGSLLIAMILLGLPFFLMTLLFQWNLKWGLAVFSFLLVIGLWYGFRVLTVWYYNLFVITDKRIIDIDQRGFFDRTVSSVDYSRIRDVAFRTKGMFQTIFHYGTILIEIAGASVRLEVRNIKNPQEVQEIINNLAKFSRDSRTGEEFNKLIGELRANIGGTEIPVKVRGNQESGIRNQED